MHDRKSTALLNLEQTVVESDRDYLLSLARRTLDACARNVRMPEVSQRDITPGMLVANHCFTTLRIGKALRGCIGSIEPGRKLYLRVIESTESAATRDPRFGPVRQGETERIHIKIAVLTKSEPLEHKDPGDLLDKLVPFTHGVIIRRGRNAATYLPQVWHHVPDKAQFLSELCIKARLPSQAWREKDTVVEVFEALSFGEAKDEEDV